MGTVYAALKATCQTMKSLKGASCGALILPYQASCIPSIEELEPTPGLTQRDIVAHLLVHSHSLVFSL